MKSKILLFLFLSSFKIFAQSADELSQIKLDQLYTGRLEYVLTKIGKEKGLKFSILDEKANNIQIDERPIDLPLNEFLNQIARKNKLKWYQGEDGIIYFVLASSTAKINSAIIKQVEVEGVENGLSAFPSKISGRIKDANTGEALPFASVTIKGSTQGTTSNVDGYFTLLNIPKSTEALLINYLGYKTRELKPNQITTGNNIEINVEPANKQLEEVIVTAPKEELMKMSDEQISTIKISPAKLATLPNAGERDIFRGFQLMPGVSAANEASSGLYVRGGTPDQNLVLYDGFTIYHVDHLYGFFSAFNANGIKDVQLYKGGFDARYGGRLSSVVQLTGKEGNSKKFNVGGDVSLLSLNLFAEMPIGDKFTSLVAVRRSYMGGLYSKIFNKFNEAQQSNAQNQLVNNRPQGGPGGFRGGGFGGGQFGDVQTTPKSYFYDLNAKFTYRPTKKDIISWSIFNGTDDLDNSTVITTPAALASRGINFDNTTNDKTNYGNLGSSLRWSRQYNDKFYNNTLVSYSEYYSTRNRLSTIKITRNNGDSNEFKTGFVEENNLKDYSVKSDFEWKLNPSNQIDFGFQFTHNNITYNYTQNDTVKVLDKNTSGNLLAVYLQDEMKLGKLKITPGVRINQFSITNKVYVEPRLNANYSITNQWKIVAATGIYNQFAQRIEREDILNGSSNFWLLPNGTNIPVSSSRHFILGTNYETKGYYFSVEGYYKQLFDITQYSMRILPRGGGPDRGGPGGGPGGIPGGGSTGGTVQENFFTGNGTSKGIEFLAQKKSGAYNGWVSYTLAQTLYEFPDFSSNPFPASQDVRHEFKMIHNYRIGRWDLSTTWIYATGRPYTAPEGGYTIVLPSGQTRSYTLVGAKNGKRLPDYHRLDVAATYNFKLGNAPSTISVSCFNVYGRKNVWYKQFSIVDNNLVETDVTNLGITPNLTLSIKLR